MRRRLLLYQAAALIVAGALGGVGAQTASASHNRASQLTWKATSNANEARIDVSFVARRSYYGEPQVGETINDPTIEFGDGDSVTPDMQVVAVDADHDVIYTAVELTHTYAGAGPYTAALTGCCRLQSSSGHVSNPDLDFRAETIVNFATLGSPHSSIDPIVDCRPETVCSFSVVGSDPGGRRLRWRMATPEETGNAAFVQPGPPFAPHAATVDANNGRYTWDSTGATVNPTGETFYSTQVIIESLDGGGDVVSATAVDFFVRLTDEADSRVTPLCVDTDANGTDDNDGDGLCDNWETTGIDSDGDGDVDLKLYDQNQDGTISPTEAADPNVKDIFVEIDHMDGLEPDLAALDGVTRAFAAAPVPIRLHYRVDDELPHSEATIFNGCGSSACPVGAPTFDELKEQHFGTSGERSAGDHEAILDAKRFAFHYVEWIDGLAGLGTTSGIAELPGNDFVVALGRWDVRGGTVQQQAGTFMHELGHNLGLHHGGGDDVNCKPNYLSVMNYTRQDVGAYVSRRPLDYSRSALATLDEGSLDENVGIGVVGPSNLVTAHGPGAPLESPVVGPIDWDFTMFGIQAFPVEADINNLGDTNCPGDGDILIGYDDWANITLQFQATADFSDGVHSTTFSQPEEVTYDSLAAVSKDGDADGVLDFDDVCPRMSDAGQADGDADGVGDACQPIAHDDAVTAPDGHLVLGAPGILQNDTVAGGSVDAGTVTTARGGSAALTADGGLTYDAPAGFTGTDTFSYRLANDPASSTATVTVDVVPAPVVPPPPVVVPPPPPVVVSPPAPPIVSLKLTKSTLRYRRGDHKLVLTFTLDAAAKVTLKLQRQVGKAWRGVGSSRVVRAKRGRNSFTVTVGGVRKGRYRIVATARATTTARKGTLTKSITIKR